MVSEAIAAKYSQMDDWEGRLKRGEALGHNTVEKYMVDIKEWFAGGCEEKGSKMSAVRMREALLGKYPRRFDIPIQYHTTAEMSLSLRAGKERQYGMDSVDGVTSVAQSREMPSEYADFLGQLVENNYAIEPREGRKLLFATPGLSEDTIPDKFPADASIWSNISQLKTVIRNH